MNRRKVIINLPIAAVFAPTIIVHRECEAAIPVLGYFLKLFLGGVVRGSITRTAVVVGSRVVASKMVTTVSLGLTASGILAVSPAIAQAFEKFNASEIWVAGAGSQNVKVVSESGSGTKREQVYLGYKIIDIDSGKVEKVGLKNVSIDQGKQISLTHLIKDLPNPGAKYIEGIGTFDSKGRLNNESFRFSEKKTVIVAPSSDIEVH